MKCIICGNETPSNPDKLCSLCRTLPEDSGKPVCHRIEITIEDMNALRVIRTYFNNEDNPLSGLAAMVLNRIIPKE